jgi:hypothetical protein
MTIFVILCKDIIDLYSTTPPNHIESLNWSEPDRENMEKVLSLLRSINSATTVHDLLALIPTRTPEIDQLLELGFTAACAHGYFN